MTRWRVLVAFCCLSGILLVGCGRSAAPPPTSTEVQEFHTAVADGDAEIVQRLLKAKPGLVNAKNEQGDTPLHVANQRGNQEVADILRKQGAHE